MYINSAIAFLVVQLVKKSACNMGDLGSAPRLGRFPGERNGYTGLYTVQWPGEFHGLHSPWSCKELDKTELLTSL